jgi:hypothetical protein
MADASGNSGPDTAPDRAARILDDLQDAVQRMHVLAQSPRVVLASGTRDQGARPMAWQALFERSFGVDLPAVCYRGAPASALRTVLTTGCDQAPTLEDGWSHPRLREAMMAGPVIQVFRVDRLPDAVAHALLGVIVFEEDGLQLAGVRALVRALGVS